MSRGVGRALGIVAAIAIPFAAPAIAGAIAGSSLLGGLATSVGGAITSALGGGAFGAGVSSAIGSGLVGAGLGAANAALTGGNIGQGALMGGIGSAISGGFRGIGGAKPPVTGPEGAFSTTGQAAAATPAVPGAGVTGAGGFAAAPGTAAPGAAIQGTAQTMLGNISRSLGNISPDVMQKAAVFLASGVLSGTSSQEKALIQQAAARMRQIEGQDKALYDTMLAEAQAISPQARGMQFYNEAQLQGIAAGEAAVEGMSPRNVNARSEISRRALQDASRNATLAYRQGYDSGATERRAAYGALAGLPRSNAALDALGLEQQRQADRAARAAGTRSAFGTIFTRDPGEAYTPEEDDEDAGTAMGLGG